MGIHGLMPFLLKHYPQILHRQTIQQLKDKTLALDVSNWLYQFLIKIRSISIFL